MSKKTRQLHFFKQVFPTCGIIITVIAALLYGLRQVGFVASLSEDQKNTQPFTLIFGIIVALTSAAMDIMLYYGLHSDQELKTLGKTLDQKISGALFPRKKSDEEAGLIATEPEPPHSSLSKKQCKNKKFLLFFLVAMIDSLGEGILAYSQANLLEKTFIGSHITWRILIALINGLSAFGATSAKEGKAAIEVSIDRMRSY